MHIFQHSKMVSVLPVWNPSLQRMLHCVQKHMQYCRTLQRKIFHWKLQSISWLLKWIELARMSWWFMRKRFILSITWIQASVITWEEGTCRTLYQKATCSYILRHPILWGGMWGIWAMSNQCTRLNFCSGLRRTARDSAKLLWIQVVELCWS